MIQHSGFPVGTEYVQRKIESQSRTFFIVQTNSIMMRLISLSFAGSPSPFLNEVYEEK